MSPLFGSKYNDEQLVSRVEMTLREDPVIDAHHLDISSKKGVITVRGRVNSEREKNHVLSAVRHALENAGLKYERIEDEIAVR